MVHEIKDSLLQFFTIIVACFFLESLKFVAKMVLWFCQIFISRKNHNSPLLSSRPTAGLRSEIQTLGCKNLGGTPNP